MFGHAESQKSFFLERTKAAREERALEKRREAAAITIQATAKGFLARRRYQRRIIADFDPLIVWHGEERELVVHHIADVYPVVRRFLMQIWLAKASEESRERFERLCRYLHKSMEAEVPKLSYAALCLHKEER